MAQTRGPPFDPRDHWSELGHGGYIGRGGLRTALREKVLRICVILGWVGSHRVRYHHLLLKARYATSAATSAALVAEQSAPGT